MKTIEINDPTVIRECELRMLLMEEFSELVDDCSPQAKRRRSELAVRISTNTVTHEDVSVAA